MIANPDIFEHSSYSSFQKTKKIECRGGRLSGHNNVARSKDEREALSFKAYVD